MKPKSSTSMKWPLLALLLAVPLLSLPGCAIKQPAQPSLPELPRRPSVTMPPTPSEILTGVQNDLSELERRRQERVRLLTPSTTLGPSTKSSKTD